MSGFRQYQRSAEAKESDSQTDAWASNPSLFHRSRWFLLVRYVGQDDTRLDFSSGRSIRQVQFQGIELFRYEEVYQGGIVDRNRELSRRRFYCRTLIERNTLVRNRGQMRQSNMTGQQNHLITMQKGSRNGPRWFGGGFFRHG